MFKAGDVVEITEVSDATGMLDFKKGKGYEVELCAGGMVNIVNESGKRGWYSKDHFKLKENTGEVAVSEFGVGDTVICIETDFYELDINDITYLKEYVVKRSSRGCIQIVKDSGELGWFSSGKFKLKEDTKVEKNECLFKKGQVVWDIIYGKGVVKSYDTLNLPYPVAVVFEDGGYEYYTEDGKLELEDKSRRLFFSEPKIEAATEPVFEPVLKEGDIVVVAEKNAHHKGCLVKVREEDAEWVKNDYGAVFNKELFDFYKVGEKIVFN